MRRCHLVHFEADLTGLNILFLPSFTSNVAPSRAPTCALTISCSDVCTDHLVHRRVH